MIFFYIPIAVFGLLIGSFLNVCIYRIPKGQSIAFPPSHCMACSTGLKPLDLLPVFSYLFLRGRCRYCGERISPRYPMIEALTAVIYCIAFWRLGWSLEFFAALYLLTVLIIVFFIDYEHMIIPNGLVIAGIIGGAATAVGNIFYPISFYGDRNLWNPLLGGVTGSGFLLLVALIGLLVYKTDEAMGMGDVKLLFPIGLFLGWKLTILALFLAVISGGAGSILLLILKLRTKKDAIPFGPYIILGTFVSMMWGWDILNWYLGRL